jgi:C1A family cysteine protease
MNHAPFYMGWLKDGPDIRDYTVDTDSISEKLKRHGETESIKKMAEKLRLSASKKTQIKSIPAKIDLRAYCSPVEDQGNLGSCTANAAMGVLEYYQRRAFSNHINGSRLFTYKTTRNLLGWTGDTGAFLRTTMASMALFGVAMEKYWPYNISRFEEEPPAFIYAMAQNYQALSYYRLDPPGISPDRLLEQIKKHLAAGLPSMFGFTCYSSLNNAVDGKIPFPKPNERTVGGHAVVAIGYDDELVIKNAGISTRGALIIRNSWGTSWGERGYGYLPYEYVLQEQADDFWVLLKNEWVNSGNFGL